MSDYSVSCSNFVVSQLFILNTSKLILVLELVDHAICDGPHEYKKDEDEHIVKLVQDLDVAEATEHMFMLLCMIFGTHNPTRQTRYHKCAVCCQLVRHYRPYHGYTSFNWPDSTTTHCLCFLSSNRYYHHPDRLLHNNVDPYFHKPSSGAFGSLWQE